jgi:hypothetical protein
MPTRTIDFAVDDNNDLLISNGDFVLKECTEKHQTDLLLDEKGGYKLNPTICVGAFTYLDDENIQSIARAASIEFTRDGMQVNSIALQQNGILNMDANYL